MDSQQPSPNTAQRDGDGDNVPPLLPRTGYYACLENAPATPAPVLLINTDILVLIFTLVAEYETPTKTSLGWIKLSHVCSAWRLVLLGMSDLWARDAYIFGEGVASKHILPRAGDSLISVSRIRVPVGLDGKFFTGFAPGKETCVLLETRDQFDLILSMVHRGTLRDLNVRFNGECTGFKDDSPLLLLAHMLSHLPQPHLRSVGIVIPLPNKEVLETGELHPMAPHPLLRKVCLLNAFTPFAALPSLSSLTLAVHPSVNDRSFPLSWLNALLDSLDSCPSLTVFQIFVWVLPRPGSHPRRVRLPLLDTLCCSDLNIFDYLELPALKCLRSVSTMPNLPFEMALKAIFERCGLVPRSMQLAEQSYKATNKHVFVIAFGWLPSRCPPSFLTRDAIEQGEPEPSIRFSFGIGRSLATRVVSQGFPFFTHIIRRFVKCATDSLQTLGFDNETREHTFIGIPAPAPFGPMLLPPFPSVRSIELPLRDNDTTYHLMHSLGVDANVANLPLLSCLKFRGPLQVAHKFMQLHQVLKSLLVARLKPAALGSGPSCNIAPITSLEFEMSSSTERTSTGFDLLLLKQALNAAVADIPIFRVVLMFEDQLIAIPQTNIPCLHLAVTIVYEPTIFPISGSCS